MSDPNSPFDSGLQTERTALAWRRTALAIVAGTIVGLRIVPEVAGPWTLLPIGLGFILAAAIFVASHRRYRTDHGTLTSAAHGRVPLSGGALPAAVAGAVLLLGVSALAFVILG